MAEIIVVNIEKKKANFYFEKSQENNSFINPLCS